MKERLPLAICERYGFCQGQNCRRVWHYPRFQLIPRVLTGVTLIAWICIIWLQRCPFGKETFCFSDPSMAKFVLPRLTFEAVVWILEIASVLFKAWCCFRTVSVLLISAFLYPNFWDCLVMIDGECVSLSCDEDCSPCSFLLDRFLLTLLGTNLIRDMKLSGINRTAIDRNAKCRAFFARSFDRSFRSISAWIEIFQSLVILL